MTEQSARGVRPKPQPKSDQKPNELNRPMVPKISLRNYKPDINIDAHLERLFGARPVGSPERIAAAFGVFR